MDMTDAYKILTVAEWQAARELGTVCTGLDRADGYVHLSSSRQLAGTLQRYFPTDDRLVILQVDVAALGDRLVWETPIPENGRPGMFPHFYGDLLIQHVAKVWQIERGAFLLPLDVLDQTERTDV